MTVIIRQVETALHGMIDSKQGLSLRQAVARAHDNLATLRPALDTAMDGHMAAFQAFLKRPDATRPQDTDLAELAQHAEAALTLCAGLNRPLLGRTLLMLAAQADALGHSRHWPPGALTPALQLVLVLRTHDLPGSEAEALLAGLGRCLDSFLEQARQIDAPS